MGELADHHVEMYSSGRWGMPYRKKNTKECKYCGQDGLMWGLHEGQWGLFAGDKLHECLNKEETK